MKLGYFLWFLLLPVPIPPSFPQPPCCAAEVPTASGRDSTSRSGSTAAPLPAAQTQKTELCPHEGAAWSVLRSGRLLYPRKETEDSYAC